MGESAFPLCAFCGDRIGVYEPVMVVTPDGVRRTSLAREPQLTAAGHELLHAACDALRRLDRHSDV